MTDNVIQFVPRPNPSRLTLLETEAVKEAIAAPDVDGPHYAGVLGCKHWNNDYDNAPCDMPPDSGDCA